MRYCLSESIQFKSFREPRQARLLDVGGTEEGRGERARDGEEGRGREHATEGGFYCFLIVLIRPMV